ncbi:MAG TPA: 30S ribosomal protein S1 [Candidatus Cloacimonadota bacterium]|nr:30S ribosomal protein S1 [Candidatus Cloacimonadota bacterium]
MLTHDQNPVEPEEKNLGEDTLSKSTDVETELTQELQQEETESVEAVTEEPVVAETPVTETIPEEEVPVVEEPVLAEEPVEPVIEATPEPIAEEMVEPVHEQPEVPVAPVVPKPSAPMSKEEQEHEDMLSMYEESFSNFKVGEIIEGTIVDVSDKDVRVDIGFKSEGVIQISEFAYSGPPEVNSVIRVYINKIESGDGRLQLSKKKADYLQNIEKIKSAATDGNPLPGIIRRRVKGGMIVDVFGIEGFLPGSQMSLKPIPNLDQFIGKELLFKVVNIDEEHSNIILSRRAVLEEEYASKRDELLKKIEIDSELDGEVKNITQYGAFIDLGGIDGLLHLTDMSWGKINHPSEMLAIGDKVKVKVINFDQENNKISLGLKQLVPHPWENIEIKYPEGTRITGKVVSVKSFGAFVEIEPGVEGLVHISEMSWTKKIADARKILKVNDTINAIVLELDKENKRISLGMKQMDPNPWLTIEDRYPIGTVLTRKVKSLTAFGAFVEIEEGIDGLVHISDISWTKRIYHPREIFRKGQEVESIILSIDRAQHRIALGIKQLAPDPWENLNQTLPVNTEVKGKISKLIPKGVLVDIPLGDDVVEGFIPISHLALPKLEHSEDAFHVGEDLPLKVIELDMDNRRLILSVKAFFFSRDPKLQEEYIAIHEQYIRDRIVRMQKKKAEKAKEKQAEKHSEETEETAVEAVEMEAMEMGVEAIAEETPASVQEAVEDIAVAMEEPVEEPVAQEEAAAEAVEEPVMETPVEPEPIEAVIPEPEVAVEEAPVEEAPVEEAPVEETPEEETKQD